MRKPVVLKTLYFLVLAAGLPVRCLGQAPASGSIVRLDPALAQLVAPDAKIEKIASGLNFAGGPVWARQPGSLLSGDTPANATAKWTPDGKVSPVVNPSGFPGTDGSLA